MKQSSHSLSSRSCTNNQSKIRAEPSLMYYNLPHLHDTNGLSPQEAHWRYCFLHQNQDIQRVVVVAQGLWDETVVVGVYHTAVQNAVHVAEASFLVKLVLDLQVRMVGGGNSAQVADNPVCWNTTIPPKIQNFQKNLLQPNWILL